MNLRMRRWLHGIVFFLSIAMMLATPDRLCASETSHAGEPAEIHFRSSVELSKDVVTLADLIASCRGVPGDWLVYFHSLELGPTPPLGNDQFIRGENLQAYVRRILRLKGYDPDKTLLFIPERITIKRKAVTIDPDQLEKIFRSYVLENAPWPAESLEIRDFSFSGLPVVPAGEITHRVQAAPKEKFLGHVTLSVHFYRNGKKVRTLRLAGEVILRKKVVHALHALRRGEIVGPDDVELRETEITDPNRNYAFALSQVVGKRVIRNMAMGDAVDLSYLDKPLLVRKGKPVTIVYQAPGLKVTAKGEAKDDGGYGDWIQVVNLTSDKILKARVLDEDTVLIAR